MFNVYLISKKEPSRRLLLGSRPSKEKAIELFLKSQSKLKEGYILKVIRQ